MLGNWEVMSYRKHFFQIVCVLLMVIFAPLLSAADKAVVAVISVVGKKGAPKVYDNITEGIKAKFHGSVKIYELREGFAEQKLLADLQSDSVDTVIALGSKSRKISAILASHYPVSIGAVSAVRAEGVGGVVWQPSSKVVLDHLSLLIPDIDALHLVYDPAKHTDMISRTEAAAKQHNIKVAARASSNNKQTQTAIERILKDSGSGRNAVWVVLETKFTEPIKENLIKDSWRQLSLIPFYYTFSPKDVELFPFVFLPDWPGMGQQLAAMANSRLQGAKAKVSSLQNIKLWVNQKKGRHYGLVLDGEVRKEIDDIYK